MIDHSFSSSCAPVRRDVDSALSSADDLSPPRSDGRCGIDFENATCDPAGGYGACCSSHGYCGDTQDHCLIGRGCQNGCSDADAAPTPIDSEPLLSPAKPLAVLAATGSPTTDGTCGANNGGTVCGDWHLGSCCSMYGYCGDTAAHCGPGCQSGPCDQAPVISAPGPSPAPMNAQPGSFNVVGQSGVPAMHAALMSNGRVVFLDKIEDYTQLKLADGYYAYSSEYDSVTNQVVPLAYKTNAFCAGGAFLADGTLLSMGGNANLSWLDPTIEDGWRGLRYLTRAADGALNGQSWDEPGQQLNTARWYPSAQTMPDGTIFVASGSLNGLDPAKTENNNPTYEILDKIGVSQGQSFTMQLLVKAQPYFMYPFLHLLRDGTLFVFTARSSEIFDVGAKATVKTFDELPGDYRTYPNTGGSVLLPLVSTNNWNPDIMICGGGAYQDIDSPTDPSCGRIQPLSDNAAWEMDSMPEGRGMVEGTLLPDGTVVWVNGANVGAQGFGLAASPTFEALIYDPAAALGQRWTRGASSTIPRLYHSVALLLLDGTLMITGSNPVQMPVLDASAENPYTTEFRVEIYTPPYLSGGNAQLRPTNVVLSSLALKTDGSTFNIKFSVSQTAQTVKIALYHGGFVTHSLHMGHRMLFLVTAGFKTGSTDQEIVVTMPPSSNIAPPGPYVVYVVVDGIPAVGQFVMVG